VAEARVRLRDAGIGSADLDARLLAEFVLGWNDERFLISGRDEAPGGFPETFDALVTRRASREPLPYIVGRREFWGLPLIVTPDVLIPRPETEFLVEAALELFPNRDEPVAIADACTGSGCVAVALATERPAASIVATDISEPALVVARQNAALNDVASRIRFVRTDLLDGIEGPFDLITCNPPYVAERSRLGLQPEVRDHEPAVALYGGADGFSLVTRFVAEARHLVRAGGALLFEFGYGQDEEVEHLIASFADLTLLELRRDLLGIARTAVVRRG
jgi:release factor glutamine methyltransferase